METIEILNTSLSKMPNEFTSNEFCKLLKRKGIDQKFIDDGKVANFLRRNSHQMSRRIWIKKNNTNFNEISNKIENYQIDICVEVLKKKGYKIMKPISQWEEI